MLPSISTCIVTVRHHFVLPAPVIFIASFTHRHRHGSWIRYTENVKAVTVLVIAVITLMTIRIHFRAPVVTFIPEGHRHHHGGVSGIRIEDGVVLPTLGTGISAVVHDPVFPTSIFVICMSQSDGDGSRLLIFECPEGCFVFPAIISGELACRTAESFGITFPGRSNGERYSIWMRWFS